jgi:hypothetical protein
MPVHKRQGFSLSLIGASCIVVEFVKNRCCLFPSRIENERNKALAAPRKAIDCGLPGFLIRAELLGLEGFQRIQKRRDFMALVNEGWPVE